MEADMLVRLPNKRYSQFSREGENFTELASRSQLIGQ